MNGASVERMGQAIHSMAYRGTWERARILDYMIQYMNHMIIESLAIFIFFRLSGDQVVMENRWSDLTILRSDVDNSVGRPKFHSPIEQTDLCPARSMSCRVHRPSPFTR